MNGLHLIQRDLNCRCIHLNSVFEETSLASETLATFQFGHLLWVATAGAGDRQRRHTDDPSGVETAGGVRVYWRWVGGPSQRLAGGS